MYDASRHPDVIAGKCTEADVLEQFISTFEGEVKDGKVSHIFALLELFNFVLYRFQYV